MTPSPRRRDPPRGPAARRPETGDRASGTVISYMVGIGIFFAVFAVTIGYMGVFSSPSTSSNDATLSARANNVLKVLTDSPGVPDDWETDTSTLTRLGLKKPGTSVTLSEAKLEQLQPGDDTLAYDDARASLGIEGDEFRIETKPVLSGLENRTALEGYRVLYLGDIDSGTDSTAAELDSGALQRTAVTFNNTTADGDGLLGEPGDKFEDTSDYVQGHLLPRLAGMYYNDDSTGVGTDGHYWKMINISEHQSNPEYDAWHPTVLTTSSYDSNNDEWTYDDGENDRIYVAKLDLSGWDDDDPVWFNFSHHASGYEGGLLEAEQDEGHVETREVANASDTWTEEAGDFYQAGENVTYTNESVTLDAYRGSEIYVSLEWKTFDVADLTGDEGSGWFIGNWTIEGRKDGEHVTFVENDLDYQTTNHDMLAVGTNVNHGEISEHLPKQGLQDWILAGGDVAAVGTDANPTSNRWLQPWIKDNFNETGTRSILEGSSNLTHHVLNTPHNLKYRSWTLTDKAYDIKPGENFDHVLMREDGEGGEISALSVSDLDADGDGDILLASYFTNSTDHEERRNLYENFLIWLRYRSLFVDFGPNPGAGNPVASAQTVTLVDSTRGNLDHPNLEVTVQLWD